AAELKSRSTGQPARKSTMRRLVMLLAIVCSGCEGLPGPSPETLALARQFPANYKGELLAYLRTFLNDLTNLSGASISQPVLANCQAMDRYFNCVRFDAKTSYGGYRGSRDYLATYLGGKLENVAELRPEAKEDRCRTASYEPFPELEKLAR